MVGIPIAEAGHMAGTRGNDRKLEDNRDGLRTLEPLELDNTTVLKEPPKGTGASGKEVSGGTRADTEHVILAELMQLTGTSGSTRPPLEPDGEIIEKGPTSIGEKEGSRGKTGIGEEKPAEEASAPRSGAELDPISKDPISADAQAVPSVKVLSPPHGDESSIDTHGDMKKYLHIMIIPTVIRHEGKWSSPEYERGMMSYIALYRATFRYMRWKRFLNILLITFAALEVLSGISVAAALLVEWGMWTLMLIPLSLSTILLATSFIIRLRIKPLRVRALRKGYYRVDILPFTDESAVIYDHHGCVGDFRFYHSDYPIDRVRKKLGELASSSLNIHHEERMISVLAMCTDTWNSKSKEFFEAPLAFSNSLLFRCVEGLLPMAEAITTEQEDETIGEHLASNWSSEESLLINQKLIEFCDLKWSMKDFRDLTGRIEETSSGIENNLLDNIRLTTEQYGSFERMAGSILGIYREDDGEGLPGIESTVPPCNPVLPVQKVMNQYEMETRFSSETVCQKCDFKIDLLKEELESELKKLESDHMEKKEDVEFQMARLRQEIGELTEEKGSLKSRYADVKLKGSATLDGEVEGKSMTEDESRIISDELESVEQRVSQKKDMIGLLLKRMRQYENGHRERVSQLKESYRKRVRASMNERDMKIADIRKEINVLGDFRDRILARSRGAVNAIRVLSREAAEPFEKRLKDIRNIKRYLLTAIENDRNELHHGIKPTEKLKLPLQLDDPVSFQFPIWKMEWENGDTEIILPVVQKGRTSSAEEAPSKCKDPFTLLSHVYPTQGEFQRFLASRTATERDFFPGSEPQVNIDEMDAFAGELFPRRYSAMIRKLGGKLW